MSDEIKLTLNPVMEAEEAIEEANDVIRKRASQCGGTDRCRGTTGRGSDSGAAVYRGGTEND